MASVISDNKKASDTAWNFGKLKSSTGKKVQFTLEKRSTPRPGRFTTSKETHESLYGRLCESQDRFGGVRKMSLPPEFDPRTVQPARQVGVQKESDVYRPYRSDAAPKPGTLLPFYGENTCALSAEGRDL